MSSNLSSLAASWDIWLDRYVPPMNLRGNETARQAEIDAQLRILMRYAPKDDVGAWLNRVTDSLDRTITTRAWPTVREIEGACTAIRREDAAVAPRQHSQDGTVGHTHLDPYRATATAMQEGRPIGDGYLWGRDAVILLRRGLVTQAQIRDYRDAFTRQMAEVWEPTAIAAHIDMLEARHSQGVKLEDAARRDWASKKADTARRMEEAAALAVNRMPAPGADPNRMMGDF